MGALIHFVLRILEERQRKLISILFHLDVLGERDEVGVKPDYAIDRHDQLLAEEQARNLFFIGRDADEAAIDLAAEPAQQGLRDVQRQTRIDHRIEGIRQ